MVDEENTVPESLVHLEARMAELQAGGFTPTAWAQELSKAMAGAVYPLSREELVLVARENEAGRTLLTLLGGLPRREYPDSEAVLAQLERHPSQGVSEP